ncbi:hypothetical protein ACH5RR_034518 [Cinchona calisaya]|uniref:RING-type domain-containing protein n=1 Tax=Cinchona calisaya TaxID=153742 RepID=A0ABD2YFN9_9GENT
MGALIKLCSHFSKFTAIFISVIIPQAIRFIILTISVSWIAYKRASSKYKCMALINEKSSKFVYRRMLRWEGVNYCSICLSEFAEGEEGRELAQCKHRFHRNCIEKWFLQGNQAATCPLCRDLVIPMEIVAEHVRVQNEQADNTSEEELALFLLSALHGRKCYGFF